MFPTIFKPREIHKLNQGNGVLYLDTSRYLQGGEVSDKTTLKIKKDFIPLPGAIWLKIHSRPTTQKCYLKPTKPSIIHYTTILFNH